MNKLHLGAHPANEGARRLAWWIAETLGGDVDLAAREFGCAPGTVERLIAGTIAPGRELALPVGFATNGFIAGKDWYSSPVAGWFDRPEARPSLAELSRAA